MQLICISKSSKILGILILEMLKVSYIYIKNKIIIKM